MRLIDETFLECPFYGARQMVRHFRRLGRAVGRRRVRRLMRKIGLSPIYQAPRTSEAHPAHKTYPYLLRKLLIERPNHVWCADVTYIPMRRGFLYLVAVMDWATRKVLAWRLSNTMEADFCVAARRTRWTSMAGPKSSTPIRAASSSATPSPARWRTRAYGSRWTVSDAPADGLNRHRSLDRLLQPAASALGAGRQDARRGPCYRNPAGEFGGLKPAVPHLSKAANLSQRPAPV